MKHEFPTVVREIYSQDLTVCPKSASKSVLITEGDSFLQCRGFLEEISHTFTYAVKEVADFMRAWSSLRCSPRPLPLLEPESRDICVPLINSVTLILCFHIRKVADHFISN